MVLTHWSDGYVSVELTGISWTPDGNTGWKVTAACQWSSGGGGGGSRGIPLPILIWTHPPSFLPSSSSGYPPLTDSQACLRLLLQVVSPHNNSELHGVMTRCMAEAKPACVNALTGLVRALRSRLKALRRLLVHAGTEADSRGAEQTFDGGRLKGRNEGTVLGCCGPSEHPSLAVSSPGFF